MAGFQPGGGIGGDGGGAGRRGGDQPVIGGGDGGGGGLERAFQRGPVAGARERGHGGAVGGEPGDGVGLLVAAHLQPVFEGAQEAVAVGEGCGFAGVDAAGGGERGEAVEGGGAAQFGRAAAPDQLVDLGEEFDFADAAAAAFEVIAGADGLPRFEMVADAQG